MQNDESTLDHEELLKHLRGLRYIVINSNYGGFSLSRDGIFKYLELAGIDYTFEPQQDRHTQNQLGSRIMVNGEEFYPYDIARDDPALVNTVRQLGSEAGGEFAILKIVAIPADVLWYIEDYDGREWVAEKHRTWR